MEGGVTVGKQFEVLFEKGAAMALEFAKQQSVTQKQRDKVERKSLDRDLLDQREVTDQELEEQASQESEFDCSYQRWYSVSLDLMGQYAPDRKAEFQGYYQPDRKRGKVDGANYVIQDWFCFRGFDEDCTYYPWVAVGRCIHNQLAILKSIKDRMEWQTLSSEAQLERAMHLDMIESARGLSEVSERAAGVLVGTMLDAWLRRFTAQHHVKLSKQAPTTADYAQALKDAHILDLSVISQITWLAEIHARSRAKGDNPTKLQVRDLIDGTRWLLINIF
jgi:hypothetical protein